MNRLNIPSVQSPKWLIFIAVVKFLQYGFLYLELKKLGLEEIDGLFVTTGDTNSYFLNIQNFLEGKSSFNACRMPGFFPIYALPFVLFGKSLANNLTILLQMFVSIYSVWILGKLTFRITGNQLMSKLAILIYSISIFVSLYDVHGLAESFSVGFLIFGLYLYYKFLDAEKPSLLFWSGFFFTWSFFFRQIAIVVYGLLGLFLILHLIRTRNSSKIIRTALYFSVVFILAESFWIGFNWSDKNRFIPFVKPIPECYPTNFPQQRFDLIKLPVAWGGLYSHWNGEAEWFLNPSMSKADFPFDNVFSSAYNLDSLDKLRQTYFASLQMKEGEDLKRVQENIRLKSNAYIESYRSENMFSYYFLNKVKLAGKFMFPKVAEKLPFPGRTEMNIVELGLKAFYTVLLWFVSLCGLIMWFKVKWSYLPYMITSFSIVSFIVLLGWVEQRYYAPVYPMMVVSCAIIMGSMLNFLKARFSSE